MALGLGKTVAELRAGLDVAELADWLAYWDAEPWGEPRADQRMGVQLYYQLSPWMTEDGGGEAPALTYPYFEDPAEAAAEIAAAREEYQRLEAEWAAAVARETHV